MVYFYDSWILAGVWGEMTSYGASVMKSVAVDALFDSKHFAKHCSFKKYL